MNTFVLRIQEISVLSIVLLFVIILLFVFILFNCSTIFSTILKREEDGNHAKLKRRNESDKHRINSSRTAFVSNAFWFEWNASHCNPSLSFSFCLTIALSLIRSLYPAENYFAELQDKEIVHKSNIVGNLWKSNKS